MPLGFASAANRTVLAREHERRPDHFFDRQNYRSRLRNWERVATVRNNPVRNLGDGGELFFTPELVPTLSHPLLTGADQQVRETVLVHRLYEYLKFTIDLEQSAVIPVTGHISRGMAGFDLPEAMRRDAFRIVTDEAWHAQFTYELMRQVMDRTGIEPVLPKNPVFTEVLARIHDEFPDEIRGVDELLFAVVSETLISSVLDELPRDDRLPRGIRETVADHADDEAKHHAYFSTLLRYLWPALTRRERELAGPYLPRLIFAFLEPDYPSVALALRAAGLRSDEVEQVVSEVYTPGRVAEDVRRGATPTLQYFIEAGALEHNATREAFEAAGLLP
jgi:hypothetical protein